MTSLRVVSDALTKALEVDWDRNAEPPRFGSIGMSGIGCDNERLMWFGYRGLIKENVSLRTGMIFEVGHRLEAMLLDRMYSGLVGSDWLLQHTDPETEQQFAASALGGHYTGHCDALLTNVVTGAKIVIDIKTAKAASFKAAQKANGNLREWSDAYWAQAQAYMKAFDAQLAVFVVICKDDCNLCFLGTDVDHVAGNYLYARAERVVMADNPKSLTKGACVGKYNDPLKWLSERDLQIYRGERVPEDRSCRSCRFGYPSCFGNTGQWDCSVGPEQRRLSRGDASVGCGKHEFLPCLVPLHRLKDGTYTRDPSKFECKALPNNNGGPIGPDFAKRVNKALLGDD